MNSSCNIQFTEGNKYLLEQSIFNRHTLLCTYVDNTTAYLKIAGQDTLTDYRYELKGKRLYKWSQQYQVWDRLEEYSLTEIGVSNVNIGYETYKVI